MVINNRMGNKSILHIGVAISMLLIVGISDLYAETNNSQDSTDRYFTFQISDKVKRERVKFKNRFGFEICADVYSPKDSVVSETKFPAVIVGGPYGAVKEQASGLYASKLADMGYIALAFDPSYTGESSGEPRNMSSPDINTEDFSACVDYLSTLPEVDNDRIGIIGICGFGGVGLNAFQSDPRIKAMAHISGTNMHWVQSQGMFNSANSPDERKSRRIRDAEKRNSQFTSEIRERDGGVLENQPADASQYNKDYTDYYKRPRGFHPNSANSNGGMDASAWISWVNTPMMERIEEIDGAVLILAGENAHTRYMGEAAFEQLTGDNKMLVIVPDAVHCDLYDGGPKHNKIPWDIIEDFFWKNL